MLRKPNVLVTPLVTTGSETTLSTSSVTLKFAICLSTLTLDSRPWWHVMHSAAPSSGSEGVMTFPEGNVTDTTCEALALWQVSHSSVPAGAGMPLATLPVDTNSWKPAEVWQRAQAVGTSGGLASFQSLKAMAFASAWPEALNSSICGMTSGASVGFGTS